MEKIANRIFYISEGQVHTFRVYTTWGTSIMNVVCAIFIAYIVQSYWILLLLTPYIVIDAIGYSEYIFDLNQNLFRKRFGILSFKVRDSYQISDLTTLKLAVAQVIDPDPELHYTKSLAIDIRSSQKQFRMYESQNGEVIETIVSKLRNTLPNISILPI